MAPLSTLLWMFLQRIFKHYDALMTQECMLS
jgi:hypothetical protein